MTFCNYNNFRALGVQLISSSTKKSLRKGSDSTDNNVVQNRITDETEANIKIKTHSVLLSS